MELHQMKEAALLINGLHLPHQALQQATTWATAENASIRVVFLTGAETGEPYPLPSDIEAAQDVTDIFDAVQSDVQLLKSQMAMVHTTLETDGITGEVIHLSDATAEQVLEQLTNMSIVFVETPRPEHPPILGVRRVDLNTMLGSLPAGVEVRYI